MSLNEKRVRYPSVSEVYSRYTKRSDYGRTLEEIVSSKELIENIYVHCLAIANNQWQMQIPDECKAYIQSFQIWMNNNVVEVLHTDIILYDDVKRFTGRIEFIVKLKESNQIVTFKLKIGESQLAWPIQIAAYSALCKANDLKVSRSFILKLSKTGKEASIFEQEDLTPFLQIFDSALTVWAYFAGEHDLSNTIQR